MAFWTIFPFHLSHSSFSLNFFFPLFFFYSIFFTCLIKFQEGNLSNSKLPRNTREKRSFHVAHHYQHRHCRGSGASNVDDDGTLASSASPYHIATQRKYPRGTQSCYDGNDDELDRFSGINRSFASAPHTKYKVIVFVNFF